MRVQKHLIFVVILFLAVALAYNPYSWFEAFAEPKDPNWSSSTPPPSGPAAPPRDGGVLQQSPSEGGGLQPLTRGQGVLPQGGFFEPPPADQRAAEPATTDPATAEEEPPVPVCEEGLEFDKDLGLCVPTECPEGQILNEETGLCVLEEQEAVEEPEEQSEETVAGELEEDQPSGDSNSESDSESEDNDNS
jgi:hypothetical protein